MMRKTTQKSKEKVYSPIRSTYGVGLEVPSVVLGITPQRDVYSFLKICGRMHMSLVIFFLRWEILP